MVSVSIAISLISCGKHIRMGWVGQHSDACFQIEKAVDDEHWRQRTDARLTSFQDTAFDMTAPDHIADTASKTLARGAGSLIASLLSIDFCSLETRLNGIVCHHKARTDVSRIAEPPVDGSAQRQASIPLFD
jgi:hypothetical protein